MKLRSTIGGSAWEIVVVENKTRLLLLFGMQCLLCVCVCVCDCVCVCCVLCVVCCVLCVVGCVCVVCVVCCVWCVLCVSLFVVQPAGAFE